MQVSKVKSAGFKVTGMNKITHSPKLADNVPSFLSCAPCRVWTCRPDICSPEMSDEDITVSPDSYIPTACLPRGSWSLRSCLWECALARLEVLLVLVVGLFHREKGRFLPQDGIVWWQSCKPGEERKWSHLAGFSCRWVACGSRRFGGRRVHSLGQCVGNPPGHQSRKAQAKICRLHLMLTQSSWIISAFLLPKCIESYSLENE